MKFLVNSIAIIAIITIITIAFCSPISFMSDIPLRKFLSDGFLISIYSIITFMCIFYQIWTTAEDSLYFWQRI